MSPKISVRNKIVASDQGHGLSVSPPPNPRSLVGSWVRLQDLKPLPMDVSPFQVQWKGLKVIHRTGKLPWGAERARGSRNVRGRHRDRDQATPMHLY